MATPRAASTSQNLPPLLVALLPVALPFPGLPGS
jgi:hypothetical protein